MSARAALWALVVAVAGLAVWSLAVPAPLDGRAAVALTLGGLGMAVAGRGEQVSR